MEFNISTFGLEIINFLILIWILQRLFYKPLLAVIAKRKQDIEQTLADAENVRQQAEKEREIYEQRQKLWEQEKQAALIVFHQQMDAERLVQLNKLQLELEQQRKINQVTLNRQQQEYQDYAQQQALKNSAKFAGILLQQAANAELEARLAQLLLERLLTLPETCELAETHKAATLKISSAYPLSTDLQLQLEQRFSTLISLPLSFQYQQDVTLIAGLRIDIGSWVLNANLKHELSGFAELAYDSQ
jgi:F-type H+-transporting ATPase subunit b